MPCASQRAPPAWTCSTNVLISMCFIFNYHIYSEFRRKKPLDWMYIVHTSNSGSHALCRQGNQYRMHMRNPLDTQGALRSTAGSQGGEWLPWKILQQCKEAAS